MWDRQGLQTSHWHFRVTGPSLRQTGECSGIYLIESASNGKFLSVDGTSERNGAKVHLSDDPQSTESHWYVRVVDRPAIDPTVNPYISGTVTSSKYVHQQEPMITGRCTDPRNPLVQQQISAAAAAAFSSSSNLEAFFENIFFKSFFEGGNRKSWNTQARKHFFESLLGSPGRQPDFQAHPCNVIK